MAKKTTTFCSARHWVSRAGSGTTGISTQGQYRPIECECTKWQFKKEWRKKKRKTFVAPLNMLIGQPVSLKQQKALHCTIPSYNLSNPNNICPNGNWIESWQIIYFNFGHSIYRLRSFPASVFIKHASFCQKARKNQKEHKWNDYKEHTFLLLDLIVAVQGAELEIMFFKKRKKKKFN